MKSNTDHNKRYLSNPKDSKIDTNRIKLSAIINVLPIVAFIHGENRVELIEHTKQNINSLAHTHEIERVLLAAVDCDLFEIVEWIIETKRPNINKQLHNNRSLLMFAKSPLMVNFLLDHGANIKHTDIYGASALIYVLKNIKDSTNLTQHEALKECARDLIERGADIERFDNGEFPKGDQRTPLGITAQDRHFELMQLLIQKGARLESQYVNIRDEKPIVKANSHPENSKEENERNEREIKAHIDSAWIKQPIITQAIRKSMNQYLMPDIHNHILSNFLGTGGGVLSPTKKPLDSKSLQIDVKKVVERLEKK